MIFFKPRKRLYGESAKILAQDGFTDEYLTKLKEEISELKKKKDVVLGKNYLINGLIIRGELKQAYEEFVQTEEEFSFDKLDKFLFENLLHNVIFSLFIRDKFKDADALYSKYNEIVLSEHIDSMRRTLAIHECINERYENAVTVLAKLLESDCRYIDLCLVKTLLKLDMYERAREISVNFDKYSDKKELAEQTAKLKNKIFNGLSSKDKVKMIKGKKR